MSTSKLVRHLEASENKIVRVVEYWIDRILGGLITEFVIDTSVSYSKYECWFFKGPRGTYLKSLKTWIKMLLCDKWLFH